MRTKRASADLLTPAFDKAGNRMRETFDNIGNALTDIEPPTSFAVALNDYRGVRFSWSDNAESESTYIVQIDGPGMFAREFYVDHLVSGALTLPIGTAGGLQHSKTYTAKIKARGGKQTKLSNVFDTDYSADISFTNDTQPFTIYLGTPEFRFTNLPSTPVAWHGIAFSFRALTNTSATSIPRALDGRIPVLGGSCKS